jgi:hypothetical protein
MVCASAQATMGNAPVLGGANSVILFATSVSPVRAINLSNSPAVVSCAGCWAAGFQASIISFLILHSDSCFLRRCPRASVKVSASNASGVMAAAVWW